MSNFSDTLPRFLDILAVLAGMYCFLVFVYSFVSELRYTGSQAHRINAIQGRTLTFLWPRYLVASVVCGAWLLAHHW